jgi:hypothetical protein
LEGRLLAFVDDLLSALIKHLPDLGTPQLSALVPATSNLPATQRQLLARRLTYALASKVRAQPRTRSHHAWPQEPLLQPGDVQLFCGLGLRTHWVACCSV